MYKAILTLLISWFIAGCGAGSGSATQGVTFENNESTHSGIDKIPPSRAILRNLPLTTTRNTQEIEVYGEPGASVWVNGVKMGVLDENGLLTVTLDTSGEDGKKHFEIVLKDANNNESKPFDFTIEQVRLKEALISGDDSNISEEDIYKAIQKSYDESLNRCIKTLKKFYPNGLKFRSSDENISHISHITFKSLGWTPIISAYDEDDFETYLAIKEFPNGTRVAIGSLPLFDQEDMKSFFSDSKDRSEILNIFKWLSGDKGYDSDKSFKSDVDFLNTPLKVMWSDRVSGWAYGGGWNRLWEFNRWIGENFSGLKGATLQSDGLPQNWVRTKHNDIPNDPSYDIYLATTPDDNFIQKVFDFAKESKPKGLFILVPPRNYYNNHNHLTGTDAGWYFRRQKSYGNAPSYKAQCQSTLDGSLVKLVDDLKNSNFHYKFPDANGGRDQNDRWNIPINVDGQTKQIRDFKDTLDGKSLDNKLFKKLDGLIDSIRYFDYKKVDIFGDRDDTSNRLLKLLLFLGDKYRENIYYPMDKVDTDNTTFFKALFADNSVSYFRRGNHYQPKMGTFLNHDDDPVKYADNKTLHNKKTLNKSLSFTTTKFDEATAIGLYAPPGKEISIRRSDSNDSVKAYIRINFTRGGIGANNSMPFSEKNLYNRPQTVSSHWIELKPFETIHISTPYGGPLYLKWNAQKETIKPILSFSFENVLEHPFLDLNGKQSESQIKEKIANFIDKISENENFSWFDIKTPFAEIHTLAENMMSVINNNRYHSDMQKYIDYLNRYLILGNYQKAGFVGGGLPPLKSNVAKFCNEHQLDCTDKTIHQKPKIQHLNSDAHALCGNACAGNPIDFDHGIDPLQQLPNHEMGHNLQRRRMTLPDGTEESNLNSVFLVEREYALDLGRDYFSGWDQIRVRFDDVFERLKSFETNGSVPKIQKPLNDHFSAVAFYAQLMWSSSLDDDDSWDFYTKMWLHERLYTDALSSSKKWEEKRELLGFGTYGYEEAKSINSIDYMCIVSSYITERDYSDFFEMWKMRVSDKAKAQIRADNITTKEPKIYFYVPQNLSREYLKWYEKPIMWPVHRPTHTIDLSDPQSAKYEP
jgi:hypothetical protein